MKLKATLFTALLACATAALNAAPLFENTPVFAKPDTTASTIATLKVGSEPVVAVGTPAPSGWTAVTLNGPHDVFAANKDVTKSLDVRVGSPYLTEAKTDAAVFALSEKTDMTEITDYRGRFTKFRLHRTVIGYIKTPANSAPFSTTAAHTGAPAATTAAATEGATTAPVTQQVGIGRAAPVGDGGSSALPRLFQGKFASTYSALRPRRPYDFQLNDEAGARYAYVDVSKLLATEQINKYVDRTVVVYGTARTVPGTKDMVVVAESLQLR
ncbi:MAG: hypothetical protein ABW223_10960 [Rariglobus sp.]